MEIELTLISRNYCHLCHDMEKALVDLQGQLDFSFKVLDVDADPILESAYDELVPVLLHGERELCHYYLDAPKVREYLAAIR